MPTNAALFNRAIERFASEEIPFAATRFLRSLATTALQRIVLRTRIKTGRARGGWRVSLNAPLADTDDGTLDGGPATIANGRAVIETAEAGDVIWFTNTVPYISYLEYGTDRFAGDFMVEMTFEELRASNPEVHLQVSLGGVP